VDDSGGRLRGLVDKDIDDMVTPLQKSRWISSKRVKKHFVVILMFFFIYLTITITFFYVGFGIFLVKYIFLFFRPLYTFLIIIYVNTKI